jgi:hypothetical protein
MATEKQIEANRANAQRSTGPRTPEGKARSSRNSLKHGLSAKQVLLPTENQHDFRRHAGALHRHFAPSDPIEAMLVDQIVVAAWRLRRARLVESRHLIQRVVTLNEQQDGYENLDDQLALAYRHDTTGSNTIARIARHEALIQRELYRALRELNRLQTLRRTQNEPQANPKETQIPPQTNPI